jgi:hypothetical protein
LLAIAAIAFAAANHNSPGARRFLLVADSELKVQYSNARVARAGRQCGKVGAFPPNVSAAARDAAAPKHLQPTEIIFSRLPGARPNVAVRGRTLNE